MPSEFAITQIVIARARSPGANSTFSSDMDSGIRNAAPTPSAARAAINWPGNDEKAAGRRRGSEKDEGAQQQDEIPLAAAQH
jgi:hypothetical protein